MLRTAPLCEGWRSQEGKHAGLHAALTAPDRELIQAVPSPTEPPRWREEALPVRVAPPHAS